MADWAWHTAPPARTFSLEETFVEVKEADGRTATYPIDTSSEAASWLRANPHKFNLGRIRLQMINDQGEHPAMEDLANVRQELDLWEGFLKSRFLLDGKPVLVQTCVPPSEDAVAVRVASSLIDRYRLEVQVEFPYPSGAWGPTMNDWESPEKHQTEIISQDPHKTVLSRTMDGTHYFCTISVLPDHGAIHRVGPHTFSIRPVPGQTLDFVVAFSQDDTPSELPANFQLNRVAASQAMQKYWNSGGAIDLSASTDPRWKELERRLVLSQYLMAIQGRGRYPSQETGLTCNSWHGKFHLEMHWWHAVHFALWGREEILEKQMAWYLDTMPVMIETARRQGYEGARWGKMLGPDGREAPSGIGPLLLWQQPHPIYYAELLYRLNPTKNTLEKYAGLIEQTAAFMADFASWNEERACFELGPPFISAREFEARAYARNKNGGFELAYWRWGLLKANEWRERMGLAKHPEWNKIALNMAPLPTENGVYIEQEAVPVADGGHPCQLASWGILPWAPIVDKDTMSRTMDHVLHQWNHQSTWGWDYPMMAMTAARIGRGDWAVESLLLDQTKNTYRPSGHNYQRNGLPLYLPGNGGLLTAVAMMTAGWDDAPSVNAPGFPQDGSWTVRWEGLHLMP
jgi:hypothetical protein